MVRSIPVHLKLLESSNIDVRVASGENIALMFESIDLHNNELEVSVTNSVAQLLVDRVC